MLRVSVCVLTVSVRVLTVSVRVLIISVRMLTVYVHVLTVSVHVLTVSVHVLTVSVHVLTVRVRADPDRADRVSPTSGEDGREPRSAGTAHLRHSTRPALGRHCPLPAPALW